MRRKFIALFFILLLSSPFMAGCVKKEKDNSNENNTSTITWYTYQEGVSKAKSSGKPVLVDFYADRCDPCRMMDAYTYTNSKVIDEVNSNFVAVKVDVDTEQSIAYFYNIRLIPTVVYLDSQGNEVYRTIGYRDANQFIQDMNIALQRI
ncbi:MAG TPA: thioredoxin [Thermoplasmatales archaeon]|nr:thioredoxin [Thermoplasmatales archaeon]